MELFDNICVPPERNGLELDEFLCLLYPEIAKKYLRAQIRDGRVLVDGMPARPSQGLRRDEVVSLAFDPDEAPVRTPADSGVRLQVLWEDEHVIAVDKPPGLAVEPERWRTELPCLSDLLLHAARGRDAGESFRPRIVHRLDKDTSGVVLAAKTLAAERSLRSAFDGGRVAKTYLALVEGEYPLADGETDTIEGAIGADKRRTGRMRVDPEHGKPATTRVAVERRFRGFTLLRCEPESGRTHQIRVHLCDRGFPLVVDPLYGARKAIALSELKPGYRRKPGRAEKPLMDRLTLHAWRIGFPRVGAESETVTVEAPLPADFQRVLKQLSKVRRPSR